MEIHVQISLISFVDLRIFFRSFTIFHLHLFNPIRSFKPCSTWCCYKLLTQRTIVGLSKCFFYCQIWRKNLSSLTALLFHIILTRQWLRFLRLPY